MKTVSERIKEGLELRNMKQADIIKKTGINKGSLSSYISGNYEPKQNNIYLIAKALDVNEAWLMGHDVPYQRQELAISETMSAYADAKKLEWKPTLNEKVHRDIAKEIEGILNLLDSSEVLLFYGDVMDDTIKEVLRISLKHTLEIARLISKDRCMRKK